MAFNQIELHLNVFLLHISWGNVNISLPGVYKHSQVALLGQLLDFDLSDSEVVTAADGARRAAGRSVLQAAADLLAFSPQPSPGLTENSHKKERKSSRQWFSEKEKHLLDPRGQRSEQADLKHKTQKSRGKNNSIKLNM